MLTTIKENSVLVSHIRKKFKYFGFLTCSSDKIWRMSKTYGIIYCSMAKLKIYLKYSFLARITDFDGDKNIFILNEGKLAQRLKKIYHGFKRAIFLGFSTSRMGPIGDNFRNQIFTLPLKMINITIITAVIVNTISLIIAKNEISPFGWLLRSLLLFEGALGLNSKVNWPTIRDNSIVLRLIKKNNVRDLRKDKF